jgi:hypothetical protein
VSSVSEVRIGPPVRTTLLVATLTAAWLGVVALVGLHRPPWGDERHYLDAVQAFGHDMSVDRLRAYEELPPPLAFALHAWWGRLVGFEPARLRLLSLATAFLTTLAVLALARRALASERDAVLGTLFFLFHPYSVGLSLFVFNDMPAILCAVLLAVGIATNRPALVVVSSAAGLMVRQYFAFLTAAAAVYYAIRWAKLRRRGDLVAIGALVASCLPLVAMFLLWQGFVPPGLRRGKFLSEGLGFNPASVTLYVTQLFTYLWPLLILASRSWVSSSRRWWVWIGVASLAYWLAPVRPSPAQVAAGHTVGFLHRVVRATIGRLGMIGEDVFFWIAFGLGLSVLLWIVLDLVYRRNAEGPDIRTFLVLSVVCFLAVMPFSYMHWEKYFMLLLPLVGILVLAIGADPVDGRDIDRAG